MNIADSFKDIVKHAGNFSFIEMVKIIGTPTSTKIETKDIDNSVIIYGELKSPIKEINNTLGLSRLGVLKGYINIHEKSDISVVTENRDGVDVPAELLFDNNDGFVSNYRFVSEAMINDQIKVPPFKGAVWDVVVEPMKASVSLLSENVGILSNSEKRFVVTVNKGVLRFNIGTATADRTSVPFAKNVTGTLKHQWSYPLSQVLAILKLTDSAEKSTLSFSDQGALKIDIDSGIGDYTFILPAGKA